MKSFINATTIILLVWSTTVLGQEFTGMATYKTDMKMDFKMDSTQVGSDEMDLIHQQITFANQKEFQLSFNKSESNWKEQEQLEKPSNGATGIQIQIVGMGGGADGLLYKNIPTKKTKESRDASGKLFLISGELEPYEWEMTTETKQIGKYTCYKAIVKREVTQTHTSEVNGKIEEKTKQIIETTTAWYTPEIPINHGPDMFWGLPGLILEVNSGNRIMICTQVVLNPEEAVTIEIPSKGKKVTSEEFKKIMDEQAEKLMKMYGGGKKKGKNSSSFSLTIEN